MDKVIKLIKNGDKGILQISEFCYESNPCQHFCIYKTQHNETIELCFLWNNQISQLLKMGIHAENVIISEGQVVGKTLEEIRRHFN
jgi:hypothetical protein